MGIYYAIVEGDPLDNGGDGQVLAGSDYSSIDDDEGRPRRQTYLGQLALCGVCKTSGPIVAGAGISQSARGFDERLGAFDAVGGDIVVCKCEPHPRVVARYARCVTYVDEEQVSSVDARPATQPGNTYDEQVTAIARGAPLDGYPYLIEMPDGQILCGRADHDGRLPRIYTGTADTYAILWGDEALNHEGWK
jgi:hypothetical protein